MESRVNPFASSSPDAHRLPARAARHLGGVRSDPLGLGATYTATVAFALIASGIVGGLLAAPFGLIDRLAIPKGTRAKAIGALHGSGNVVPAEPHEPSAQARSA